MQPHSRNIDETRQRLSVEERRERAAQLQRTMNLLKHASACREPACPSSNCHRIKELYRHAGSCRTKVMGGCVPCRCAGHCLLLPDRCIRTVTLGLCPCTRSPRPAVAHEDAIFHDHQ